MNSVEAPIDYIQFLNYYEAFINPIADTYAWCLLKNHFHLLVRIKNEPEIGYLNSVNSKSNIPDIKWQTYFPDVITPQFKLKPNPKNQFQHLFNAYALWYNIKNNRKGNGRLFERHFERIEVDNMKYFNNLVAYIHNNPVKHSFVSHSVEYGWSSYITIQSAKTTKLMRHEVLKSFGSLTNFEVFHNKSSEEIEAPIKNWIIE